jgi:hypothetical protein
MKQSEVYAFSCLGRKYVRIIGKYCYETELDENRNMKGVRLVLISGHKREKKDSGINK